MHACRCTYTSNYHSCARTAVSSGLNNGDGLMAGASEQKRRRWYGIATGIIMHACIWSYGPSINGYKETGRKCRQVGMQAASLEARRKNHVIVMHDQMDDPRPRDAATVLLPTRQAGDTRRRVTTWLTE